MTKDDHREMAQREAALLADIALAAVGKMRPLLLHSHQRDSMTTIYESLIALKNEAEMSEGYLRGKRITGDVVAKVA